MVWRSIDVLGVGYDGERGSPVVLASAGWETEREGAQRAVDEIHALMAERGLGHVLAEIMEGGVFCSSDSTEGFRDEAKDEEKDECELLMPGDFKSKFERRRRCWERVLGW